jgi:hypothetical protein
MAALLALLHRRVRDDPAEDKDYFDQAMAIVRSPVYSENVQHAAVGVILAILHAKEVAVRQRILEATNQPVVSPEFC